MQLSFAHCFTDHIESFDGVHSCRFRLSVVEAQGTDTLVTALHSQIVGRTDRNTVLEPLHLGCRVPLHNTVQF